MTTTTGNSRKLCALQSNDVWYYDGVRHRRILQPTEMKDPTNRPTLLADGSRPVPSARSDQRYVKSTTVMTDELMIKSTQKPHAHTGCPQANYFKRTIDELRWLNHNDNTTLYVTLHKERLDRWDPSALRQLKLKVRQPNRQEECICTS
jgi:hypothetical protein